jgi:gas vesicle protein
MKTERALLGVLAGIAAGATLGILFAPNRGDKTRGKISRKAGELTDTINKKIDDKFSQLLKTISKS